MPLGNITAMTDAERQLLMIKGAVPGSKGGNVVVFNEEKKEEHKEGAAASQGMLDAIDAGRLDGPANVLGHGLGLRILGDGGALVADRLHAGFALGRYGGHPRPSVTGLSMNLQSVAPGMGTASWYHCQASGDGPE